jgi:tetratricopeptide (TPR) repeat protein
MRSLKSITLVMLAVVTTSAAAQTFSIYQTTNPYYPKPNPFYFEGKVTWEYLGITTPSNFWEYLQRGIHKQDDLDDDAGAIADYQTALAGNSLQNGTCQIVTAATLVNGRLPSTLSPPPCMFTVRLRLGHLLLETNPDQAIKLFQEVTQIDPLRLDTNALIGEAYVVKAEETADPAEQQANYQKAIQAFQAELALSPVTSTTIAQTADQANNAHVHWELAEIYDKLGMTANEKTELQAYLLATQWHSDTYPWRVALAQQKLKTLP